MKINDVKHNHSLTDLLKVLIFSILMITPLLSVATRCLYVICNKNAYQSYENTSYIEAQPIYYESNEVITYQDLLVDKVYHYSDNFVPVTVSTSKYLFKIYATDNIKSQFQMSENVIDALFYINTYGNVYIQYTDNGTQYKIANNIPFDFVIKGLESDIAYTENIINYFSISEAKIIKEIVEVQQNGTLDNVFEYSLNKLQESPIINWTSNTAVYTGVNTMTTQLGITQNVIPMLITYWFLLTIIYVILDIVLKLFTILTHMIGGKKSN